MQIGLDIDNVITDFDKKLLEDGHSLQLIRAKNVRNIT